MNITSQATNTFCTMKCGNKNTVIFQLDDAVKYTAQGGFASQRNAHLDIPCPTLSFRHSMWPLKINYRHIKYSWKRTSFYAGFHGSNGISWLLNHWPHCSRHSWARVTSCGGSVGFEITGWMRAFALAQLPKEQ